MRKKGVSVTDIIQRFVNALRGGLNAFTQTGGVKERGKSRPTLRGGVLEKKPAVMHSRNVNHKSSGFPSQIEHPQET